MKKSIYYNWSAIVNDVLVNDYEDKYEELKILLVDSDTEDYIVNYRTISCGGSCTAFGTLKFDKDDMIGIIRNLKINILVV